MISNTLLAILRCPIDGQTLEIAGADLLTRLQQQLASGSLRDHLDGRVEEPFDQALVTQKGDRVYPIRSGIPTLIPSESIPVPEELRI